MRSLFECLASIASDLTGPCSDVIPDFFTAEKADEELVVWVGELNDRLDEVGGDGSG